MLTWDFFQLRLLSQKLFYILKQLKKWQRPDRNEQIPAVVIYFMHNNLSSTGTSVDFI